MSYPQFNLTTLQLPAPASNMTKTEYKAAYGIDLDEVNIKAFKLVLLGKDKYPIDQIKEVEGGYEIYFNGRILSITDTIETSDEVYDVVNSKPIYWHTIYLVRGGVDASFTFTGFVIILNNDPEPLSLTEFLKLLKTPGFKAVVINGQCATSALGDITNLPNMLLTLEYDSGENYKASYVVGDDATIVIQAGIGSAPSTFQQFIDLGVNKIN